MSKASEAILQISKEDSLLQTNRKKLKALPEKKRKIRIPLKRVESVLDKLKEQEEEICGQIRERETLVEVENEKIKRSDERMLAVKNQKEYVASQKEIETARKTIKKVEDQILELEEKKNAITSELIQILEEYKQTKATVGEAEKEVISEEKKFLDKIETYQKMKDKLLPQIDPDLVDTYNLLTNRKIIPAAVEISNPSCMGCALSIPAQLFNEIIRDSVGKCPHCGRLLFYKEPEKPKEDPKEKAKKKAKSKAKKKSPVAKAK
ncbi:MAG: C4-type zinc ribbon domain-containing protein [bacterium]